MKRFCQWIGQALLGGVLLLAPIYIAVLLLLKAMKSLERVVQPLAHLLPKSVASGPMIALLFVLLLCLLVGILIRTSPGQAVRARIENSFLRGLPGYETVRGMSRQLSGEGDQNTWKPALVEIEEALVPGFIVEELATSEFTVFVPSAPTPLVGTIYILKRERVHPLDVPFTEAVKILTRWGSGSKILVEALQNPIRAPVLTR